MSIYVAEIAGRATFAFDADSEDQAKGYLSDKSFLSDLYVLQSGGRSLWNGKSKSDCGQRFLMRRLSGKPATILPIIRRRLHGYSSYRLSIRYNTTMTTMKTIFMTMATNSALRGRSSLLRVKIATGDLKLIRLRVHPSTVALNTRGLNTGGELVDQTTAGPDVSSVISDLERLSDRFAAGMAGRLDALRNVPAELKNLSASLVVLS